MRVWRLRSGDPRVLHVSHVSLIVSLRPSLVLLPGPLVNQLLGLIPTILGGILISLVNIFLGTGTGDRGIMVSGLKLVTKIITPGVALATAHGPCYTHWTRLTSKDATSRSGELTWRARHGGRTADYYGGEPVSRRWPPMCSHPDRCTHKQQHRVTTSPGLILSHVTWSYVTFGMLSHPNLKYLPNFGKK